MYCQAQKSWCKNNYCQAQNCRFQTIPYCQAHEKKGAHSNYQAHEIRKSSFLIVKHMRIGGAYSLLSSM